MSANLDALLAKANSANLDSFSETDIDTLLHAFIAQHASEERSKAYVLLSALCQKVRGNQGSNDDDATDKLAKFFGRSITNYLTETNDASLRVGICSLHALFQVDLETAVAILSQEGVVENIMEGIDLSRSIQLFEDVAHLLGQASSHKRCREIIPPQAVEWLQDKSRQATDIGLRAAAAVALVKYSKGTAIDSATVTPDESSDDLDQEERLAEMMKGLIVSGVKQESLIDAVEGLAYLSIRPELKEILSTDAAFLRQLFSLIPRRKPSTPLEKAAVDSSMLYGILVIITNTCAYHPQLSEEQAQIEKLKKMAHAGKKKEPSPLESDNRVMLRVRRLVDVGALGVIGAALTISDSLAVRLQLGKALYSIIENKENRGKVLQSGGGKVLTLLIKNALQTLTSKKDQELNAIYLETIQALAKLAITSSPIQVFGPNIGATFDAIRPFSILLQHSGSTLLQRFEASMALTNLASYQPDVAERISQADGLVDRVELLMFEDHVLVRRSAVELICNLIAGSDELFGRYGGGSISESAKSKIQILVALADVDDIPTVLAASGALATLTCSPHACRNLAQLQQEKHRVLPILTHLIDPSAVIFTDNESENDNRSVHENTGLVHRGVACVRNLFVGLDDVELRKSLARDAKAVGLVEALLRLIKGAGMTKEQMIVLPAAEVLQLMVKDGLAM